MSKFRPPPILKPCLFKIHLNFILASPSPSSASAFCMQSRLPITATLPVYSYLVYFTVLKVCDDVFYEEKRESNTVAEVHFDQLSSQLRVMQASVS